jgi:peptide/nickel transport system permease protein
MIRRVARRLLWAVTTLIGTSVIVFTIVHVVPADPIAAYAGPQADAETRERIRRELGLDDPVWQQYLRFVTHAARGDFGRSYVTQQRVVDAIRSRFPTTLALCLGGLTVWLTIAIPVGVFTARRRDSFADRSVLVLAMVSVSLPTFWLGRLLQFQLAYRHGLLPVAGLFSWEHIILPSITLGAVGVGYYARLVHSSMIEVLNQDYIRTARAKGLPERTVLIKHGLRNALIPVLTILGMDTAALLGGVVFTETVFALPGLGALALQAVINLDIPMIMGTVMFAAVLVVGANVLVDMLYAWVDPRIRPT